MPTRGCFGCHASRLVGGTKNHSRLTSMTYPGGRVLDYAYTSADGDISRVSFMSDGDKVEAYSYLGLGTVVERDYNGSMVRQSYIKLSGESTGDAGDQYTGLDRFGRVVRQRWLDSADDPVEDFLYGYDPNGNRLWRSNELDHDFDELYHANGSSNGYDQLNQLLAFGRGELNSGHDSITATTRNQSWSMDALGNFSSVTTGSTTETRSHDSQNRLNSIVVGSTTTTLTHDANGNMLTDEQGRTYMYDAWNRLTKYDDTTFYRYDALGRRNYIRTPITNSC